MCVFVFKYKYVFDPSPGAPTKSNLTANTIVTSFHQQQRHVIQTYIHASIIHICQKAKIYNAVKAIPVTIVLIQCPTDCSGYMHAALYMLQHYTLKSCKVQTSNSTDFKFCMCSLILLMDLVAKNEKVIICRNLGHSVII